LESNWRLNLALFGLEGMGLRLFARVAGSTFLAISTPLPDQPTKWVLWGAVPSEVISDWILFRFPIGAGQHFPYGVSVEAD